MKAAQPSDWRTSPLPDQRSTIRLDRVFSRGEIARIRRGVIPDDMADKWFVYWQDDVLHFFRSWTGFCIYVASFTPCREGYRLHTVEVNGDREQYGADDDADEAAKLHYLIDVLLLRKDVAYPGSDGAMGGWGMVGRALLGQHPDDPEGSGDTADDADDA